MSDNLARVTATASEDELNAWASVQPDAEGNMPDIEVFRDLGLPDSVSVEDLDIRVNGEWHNPFWYH